MPLWRHGGVLSVEIESKIKTSCAGKSKELHSQLHRYEGMQLLTCGSDKFGPEAFEIHTYDTKNRAARGRRGDN